MVVNDSQLAAIREQVAFQTEFITMMHRVSDYSMIKLFNPVSGTLVSPPDLMRRGNDILAAAYAHALALDQQSGDDCIDVNGHTIELKLAYIKASRQTLSKNRTLLTKAESSDQASRASLFHSTNARFRVYGGTKANHHNKDTAFVLMSYDLNCFITGFMLPGDEVQRLLTEGNQTGVQRNISLSQFIKYGYEFGSSVPHIGWERFNKTLVDFVEASEGKVDLQQAEQALIAWTDLANLNNLQTL